MITKIVIFNAIKTQSTLTIKIHEFIIWMKIMKNSIIAKCNHTSEYYIQRIYLKIQFRKD